MIELGLLLGVRKLALGDSKQTITRWAGELWGRSGVSRRAQGRHWGILRSTVLGHCLRIACALLGEQCARLGEQNEARAWRYEKAWGGVWFRSPWGSQVGFGWWRTSET